MNNSVFVDTRFYLAIINPRDKYHGVVRDVSAGLSGRPFITSEAVLMEVGNALSRLSLRHLAVSALRNIRADGRTEIITIDTSIFDKSVQLFSERRDKEWGLTDCTSFIIMQQLEIRDVLTADHHFEQAGFIRLIRG